MEIDTYRKFDVSLVLDVSAQLKEGSDVLLLDEIKGKVTINGKHTEFGPVTDQHTLKGKKTKGVRKVTIFEDETHRYVYDYYLLRQATDVTLRAIFKRPAKK